ERRRTLPDAVRWRWVLSGGPKLKVAHPWLAGHLLVSPTWNGIGISGQSLRLPASALATLDARVEAIGPTGELSLKCPATFIGLTARSAGATLLDAQWHNAGAALAPIRPLGHYQLTLTQSASDGIEVHLDTTTGPLILSGKGVMSASGRFTFDGAAQSDPKAGSDTQVALHDLLAALGPTTNNLTTLRFR